ncbi:MAG: radical SAM family heme chaperone HemW [Spirochaetes bacterium]|nr:MAG: radical SAM family heme chaperone HemW [Spirochaetota bacterium]
MKAGVYLHIPFCRSKCDYCGFYSVPVDGMEPGARDGLLARYAEKLIVELRARAGEIADTGADTLYLGGGTPSLMGPALAGRLIDAVRGSVDLDKDAEITLECNPEDFTPETLAGYRDAGINRVVLGVQTLRAEEWRFIGRRARLCGEADLRAFMGVPGIAHCVDLIAGIPGGNPEDARGDAHALLDVRPEHVSAYMLSLEKGTPLAARFRSTFESEKSSRDSFEALMDGLVGGGYTHYEISNFALPGFQSRHNLKYWRFLPYLGLGASAHSFTGGMRRYNVQSMDEYVSENGVRLSLDARGANAAAAEFIMTGLRLIEGISVSYFEEMLGFPLPDGVARRFEELKDEGLVERTHDDAGNGIIRLTREGLFRADDVIFRASEPLL